MASILGTLITSTSLAAVTLLSTNPAAAVDTASILVGLKIGSLHSVHYYVRPGCRRSRVVTDPKARCVM